MGGKRKGGGGGGGNRKTVRHNMRARTQSESEQETDSHTQREKQTDTKRAARPRSTNTRTHVEEGREEHAGQQAQSPHPIILLGGHRAGGCIICKAGQKLARLCTRSGAVAGQQSVTEGGRVRKRKYKSSSE